MSTNISDLLATIDHHFPMVRYSPLHTSHESPLSTTLIRPSLFMVNHYSNHSKSIDIHIAYTSCLHATAAGLPNSAAEAKRGALHRKPYQRKAMSQGSAPAQGPNGPPCSASAQPQALVSLLGSPPVSDCLAPKSPRDSWSTGGCPSKAEDLKSFRRCISGWKNMSSYTWLYYQ